jgi:cytochrome d ubiquinol oxidase subunit I
MNPLQEEYEQSYGRGESYRPNVRATYWSMRVMAYLGTLTFLVAALGAFLYRRRRLEAHPWFLRLGVLAIAFPYVSALAGWVLTEMGRQPWIVFGLLRTEDASSPSVSTATIAFSLGTFVVLYAALAVVDFVLMRRYATTDPPDPAGGGEEPEPAVGY